MTANIVSKFIIIFLFPQILFISLRIPLLFSRFFLLFPRPLLSSPYSVLLFLYSLLSFPRKQESRVYTISSLIIFTVFCFYVDVSFAKPAESNNKIYHNKVTLKNLQNKISLIKTDISKKEKQQTSVEQQLTKAKLKISLLEAKYNATLRKLKSQKNILAVLNYDQAKHQEILVKVQQKFLAQILSAYQLDHPDYFKIIFYPQELQNSDLFLDYHRYVFIARLDQMYFLRKTINKIKQNKEQIKRQTEILVSLENEQHQQQLELLQAQKEQEELLKSLKNRIESQTNKLKDLLVAKRSLEKLIIRLTAETSKKSLDLRRSIGELCRNFVWPTSGKIITHFGSVIEESSLTWSGIVISAQEGQHICAISSGKVAYSGRLAGYGLLLIIDHGNSYMSIYGHNKSLLKKAGDKITAGEVVATVGKSDCDTPRLYFAIRYHGRPVNPEKWCR